MDTINVAPRVKVTVPNKNGIHARPAMDLSHLAETFRSTIMIKCFTEDEQRTANAKSLMSLLTLIAVQGTELTITARGRDAQAACVALKTFVEQLTDTD